MKMLFIAFMDANLPESTETSIQADFGPKSPAGRKLVYGSVPNPTTRIDFLLCQLTEAAREKVWGKGTVAEACRLHKNTLMDFGRLDAKGGWLFSPSVDTLRKLERGLLPPFNSLTHLPLGN